MARRPKHEREKQKQQRARKQRPPARREPDLDAAEDEMIEAVAQTGAMLACPVDIAVNFGEACAEIGESVETSVQIARLAAELHPGSGMAAELRSILTDYVALMERHGSELAQLSARFAKLDDHDADHAHVELDDEALERVGFAMFGAPDGDEERP